MAVHLIPILQAKGLAASAAASAGALLWTATGGSYDRTLLILVAIALAGAGCFVVATRRR